MFDITTQFAADTAAIHLKGLDGEPLYYDNKPVQIVIHGPGSQAHAQMKARQTNRILKRMNDNDGKMKVAPFEEQEIETAEDLASITVAFENLVYPPAQDLTGTEKFKMLYLDRKLGFITQQVAKASGEWGNFKSGAKSVSETASPSM